MIGEPAPSLLIADDDPTFCQVLARALERRGFTVAVAHDVPSALSLAQRNPPQYAVIDLKMPGPSGLELVTELRALNAGTRIVVLTGYASIATAVEAIKLGATHYLAKPANADEILAALQAESAAIADAAATDFQPLSVARLEWEHIQKVLAEHDGNISATARALNMHRRTLQRKLAKRPVRK
ncbi:MAG TPA: response regulator transcription factor [Burkholderiales bacterium]|nr:response regulator transcription factor [Burkholderiales bacterium]